MYSGLYSLRAQQQKDYNMKKIAVFIAPNPMHPNTRLMGIETTKMVANAAEAVALAEKNNWEFCGFRT